MPRIEGKQVGVALLVGSAIGLCILIIGLTIYWGERWEARREATALLDAVWSRAVVYYYAEHQTVSGIPEDRHFLQGTAPFESGPECGCQSAGQGGDHCPGNDPIWERDPVWQALGFSMTEPHRYKVSYEGGPDGFVVRVRGDRDGDGILAEYSRRGTTRTVAYPDEAQTIVVNPYE